MMKPNEHDRVAVARYLDGEMAVDERERFEVRLRSEPLLADVEAEAQALRGVFVCAQGEAAPALRSGFSDRVVRRLQNAESHANPTEVERRVLYLARACVVAAAIVFVVATLFATGVLQMPDSGHLQADTSAELIRALDAKMQAAQQPGVGR